jgi:hypothetical protein
MIKLLIGYHYSISLNAPVIICLAQRFASAEQATNFELSPGCVFTL